VHDRARPKPPVLSPPAQQLPAPAPDDAIVLFDGKDLSGWRGVDGGPAKWAVAGGELVVAPGADDIKTKPSFGDVQLHVEWTCPSPATGTGQQRGNSGVYLMGLYECQILDSYESETYADGQAAAVYGQYPPLVNVCRPPGQWQSFDIVFHRPHFDAAGRCVAPARMTVLQNGVLVQDDTELLGPTGWLHPLPYRVHPDKLPILLQEHGTPVRFRNLWVRNLPERAKLPAGWPEGNAAARPPAANRTNLTPYVGAYTVLDDAGKPLYRLPVTSRGGFLTLAFPFLTRTLELAARSPHAFVSPTTDVEVDFVLDPSGKVTGLTFRVAGETIFTARRTQAP
jgi:hypothetical protein